MYLNNNNCIPIVAINEIAVRSPSTLNFIIIYTITAKAPTTKTLITAYSDKSTTNTGELILKLNNQSYDLANASHNTAILSDSGLSYSGTIEVKPSVPTNLTAQLSLANNNKDQSFLANTSAIINISAKITTCNLKTS